MTVGIDSGRSPLRLLGEQFLRELLDLVKQSVEANPSPLLRVHGHGHGSIWKEAGEDLRLQPLPIEEECTSLHKDFKNQSMSAKLSASITSISAQFIRAASAREDSGVHFSVKLWQFWGEII